MGTENRGTRRATRKTGSWCLSLLVSGWVASGIVACDDKKSAKQAPPRETAQKEAAAKEAPPSGVDALTFPTIGEMKDPEDNASTEAKVSLGHQLFFDKRLSADGSVSCYSCHQNEDGNGGHEPIAIGAKGKKLTRHSPVIWNVGYLPAFYWDGRADSLEAQAKGAWGGGNMGVGAENLEAKAKEIAQLPEYKTAFAEVFPDREIGATEVVQAISAYERTLVCKDTAFDKYAAGDKTALTAEQKKGLELFTGKAMCTACHAPPFFSTAYMGKGAYFNVGVGTPGVKEEDVDVGRMAVTEDEKDWAAFKVPSLRNVTKSAPYFHDGHEADLKRAVKFMASGGYDNKNKTPLMMDKKLTDEEVDLIVTFLSALDCGTLEEPKDG